MHEFQEVNDPAVISQLDNLFASAPVERTDYNALATKYNEKAVSSNFFFPWAKSKQSSLVSQFTKRGLKEGVDFAIRNIDNGGVETAVIRRLSAKPAEMLTVDYNRGGKKNKTTNAKPAVALSAAQNAPQTDGESQDEPQDTPQDTPQSEPQADTPAEPPKAAGKRR